MKLLLMINNIREILLCSIFLTSCSFDSSKEKQVERPKATKCFPDAIRESKCYRSKINEVLSSNLVIGLKKKKLEKLTNINNVINMYKALSCFISNDYSETSKYKSKMKQLSEKVKKSIFNLGIDTNGYTQLYFKNTIDSNIDVLESFLLDEIVIDDKTEK